MELTRIQTRELPTVETREDGKRVLAGYAAVFHRSGDPGTEINLWGNVFERIMPGAFDRALKDGDDVRALFNHDRNFVLGRSLAGTMRLRVDARGLFYEIDLGDTQVAKDVEQHVKRGDVTGSSFGFLPDDSGGIVWREEATKDIREVHSVRLYDVGPVTYPWYGGATASLRSEYDTYASCKNAESDKVDFLVDFVNFERSFGT